MLRILTGALALGMLLTGIAWATDSEYDIIDETDSPAYEGEADYTYTEAGEPVPIDSANLGMYFGTGDQFIGGYQYSDGTHYTSQDYAGDGHDYHDEQIYYPEYIYGHGSGDPDDHAHGGDFDYGSGYADPDYAYGAGYAADNVYGPMWGVPGDAVGTEGWDPHMYAEYGGDPSQVQHNHGESANQGDEYVDYEDGLNISGSDEY
jgi:hypothetical protein